MCVFVFACAFKEIQLSFQFKEFMNGSRMKWIQYLTRYSLPQVGKSYCNMKTMGINTKDDFTYFIFGF